MDSFQILALMLMLACAYMLYCIRNIVLSRRDDTRLYQQHHLALLAGDMSAGTLVIDPSRQVAAKLVLLEREAYARTVHELTGTSA